MGVEIGQLHSGEQVGRTRVVERKRAGKGRVEEGRKRREKGQQRESERGGREKRARVGLEKNGH